MQLQSIDQVSLNTEVWHPTLGKGTIYEIYGSGVSVNLKGRGVNIFWDDRFANATPKLPLLLLSHLYTSPATVIAESEVTRLKELVKAQKEYIDFIQKRGLINYYEMTIEDVLYHPKLIDKINQLQSKTDK